MTEPTPCTECGGSGWKVFEDGTLGVCQCGARNAEGLKLRLALARIPERFANKSLDTFLARDPRRRDILHSARAYAQGFHMREEMPGLILRGKAGAGKTHVAIGILKEVILQGWTGVYCNVTELLARLRSTYEDHSDEAESEVIEELTTCDLLVLDDLGSEAISAWVLDRLYLLINRRYEAMRPILITTNCDERELAEKAGPRIASRLYEICKAPFPPFPNEDYRIKMLHESKSPA